MGVPSKKQPPITLESLGEIVSWLGVALLVSPVAYYVAIGGAWLKRGVWISYSLNDWLSRDVSSEASATGWIGFDTMVSYLFSGPMGITLPIIGVLIVVVGALVWVLGVTLESKD